MIKYDFKNGTNIYWGINNLFNDFIDDSFYSPTEENIFEGSLESLKNADTGYEIEISNIVSLPNGKIIEKITDCTDTSNNTIRLNSADLTLPLYVRNKRNGDKIEVKGMNGTKKISDIFIDEKIKPSQRSSWPVVLDSKDNIIWLPGLKKSKFDKKISQEYDIILRYR